MCSLCALLLQAGPVVKECSSHSVMYSWGAPDQPGLGCRSHITRLQTTKWPIKPVRHGPFNCMQGLSDINTTGFMLSLPRCVGTCNAHPLWGLMPIHRPSCSHLAASCAAGLSLCTPRPWGASPDINHCISFQTHYTGCIRCRLVSTLPKDTEPLTTDLHTALGEVSSNNTLTPHCKASRVYSIHLKTTAVAVQQQHHTHTHTRQQPTKHTHQQSHPKAPPALHSGPYTAELHN